MNTEISNIIEVVFEDVPKVEIVPLVTFVISKSTKSILNNIGEYAEIFPRGQFDVNAFDLALESSNDICISLNLIYLKVGSIFLPLTNLRILKYGGKFDIDFNFELDKMSSENETSEVLFLILHGFVKELSGKHDVKNYYCGLEPASDVETRIFTK